MIVLRHWLARLDTYGTDDPDFNEGHPEDRCPVCGRPVYEHLGQNPVPGWHPAKWPHRRAAAIALLLDNL